MRTLAVAGIVVVSVAIGTCLLLGTLGWFAVGFGLMTDCTDNYNCTASGCPPCSAIGRWINAGGVAQLFLTGVGVVVRVLGIRAKSRVSLVVGGAVLLVTSVLTIVGTTRRAQDSYCQPGTPGYATSYCSVDD